MKKIDIFTIAALTVTLLPVSCQMEEPAEELTYTVNVPIVFGDNPTTEEAEAIIEVKADVDGTSGVTTWTTGDQIAYYVSGAGANKYQVKTINGTIVPVSLTSSQSREGFAVYPPASANATYHTAANLKVKYPATYDFSGMTALQMATFSPLPMVGDNTQPNIVLYNVGGLLRLTVNNVPATAKYIKVTVPGMNITGDFTVSDPDTTTPSVAVSSGSNDNVTFQIAETTIGTQGNYTVNLPLPAGDYSGVTGKTITVEALNGSSSSIAAANGAITHWTTLGRRKGKKLTVDFAPASFGINEGETTIWKSLTATFTTNAAVGSVTWESDDDDIATFDDPTVGEVRGVAAGTTQIRAKLNGMVYSDWVTVNVNAVTGVTLDTDDSKYKVAPSGTKALIATLTHTTNGAITTYPTVTWDSESTTYVTVSPASSTAVYATDGTAIATTTATGVTAVGSSECTVTVAGGFSDNNSDRTSSVTVTCEDITTITFPFGGGEKYKFRGYWIHPGFLFEAADGTMSITGCDPSTGAYDPLILLQHYYYDSMPTKFSGASGAAWKDRCYFTWTELYNKKNDGTNITWTLDLTDTYGGGVGSSKKNWHIPSGSSDTGEWYYICNNPHTTKIKINNSEYSTSSNTGNIIFVNVSLADAPTQYQGKGLGYDSDHISNNAAGSKAYQAGMLIVPDGAYITCSRIKSVPGNSNSYTTTDYCNVIKYDDLKILQDGGCIFLPATGSYGGGNWYPGFDGNYWTATYYSDGGNGYRLYFNYSSIYFYKTNPSYYRNPVCLVRGSGD